MLWNAKWYPSLKKKFSTQICKSVLSASLNEIRISIPLKWVIGPLHYNFL